MCGIVGAFSENEENNKSFVNLGIQRLKHRGPDSHGITVKLNGKLVLGHTRLALQDLSASGAQPMTSASGSHSIVFNGEIYNKSELTKILKQNSDVELRGHSDTEVILELFSLFSPEEVMRKINGMFAIGLLDEKKNKFYLLNDRFGQKPLMYCCEKNSFSFFSEIRMPHSVGGKKFTIDKNALTQYLRFGFVPFPLSIFKEVKKIEPGTLIEFDLSKPTNQLNIVKVLDQPNRKEHNSNRNHSFDIRELDGILYDAVERHLIADVEVGTFLSGGVDSSLVSCYAADILKSKLKTFSIGFGEALHDETPFAESVAQTLNTNHTTIRVTPNDIKQASLKLPKIYDEPFSDVSQILTYILCEFASNKVRCVLTGDAADELFCGYNRHIHQTKISKLRQILPISLLKKLKQQGNQKFILNFLNSIWPDFDIRYSRVISSIAANSDINSYFSILSSNGIENLMLPSELINDDFTDMPCSNYDYLDRLFYLPNDIFVKVDRASMNTGLEARVPFLDEQVVDYSLNQLSVSQLIGRSGGKLPLKTILSDKLPNIDFTRSKRGFGFPINKWLRGDLKPMVLDQMNCVPSILRGHIDEKKVEEIVTNYYNHKHNRGDDIWKLYSLYSWANNFI